MPLFPWAAGVMETDIKEQKRNEEIEAIMTFVLGLVAEPPAPEYVYQPDTRRDAIVQGEKVLAKFKRFEFLNFALSELSKFSKKHKVFASGAEGGRGGRDPSGNVNKV